MPRRLAAFFTIMAFILFASTWLFRTLLKMPVMDINRLFIESWIIIVVYMIIGLFLARLGIALVMEVLEERRRREEERRMRARMRYQDVINAGGLEGGGDDEEDAENADGMEADTLPAQTA